jgi:hypothetical protein
VRSAFLTTVVIDLEGGRAVSTTRLVESDEQGWVFNSALVEFHGSGPRSNTRSNKTPTPASKSTKSALVSDRATSKLTSGLVKLNVGGLFDHGSGETRPAAACH